MRQIPGHKTRKSLNWPSFLPRSFALEAFRSPRKAGKVGEGGKGEEDRGEGEEEKVGGEREEGKDRGGGEKDG